MDDFIKKFARKYLNLELRRFNVMNSPFALIKHLLESHQIDLLLDVGGFVGTYGEEAREMGYKGELISFEPIKASFDKLKSKADKDPKWSCQNIGFGTKSEALTINIAGNFASSSLLGMHKNHTDLAPDTAYQATETIQIRRLDEVITPEIAQKYQSIYLKIDVQGYELNVLAGATALLPYIQVVQAEISFVPLYEQGPLYHEVISKLDSLGFELFTILPELKDPKNGRLMQGEGIFVRKQQTH
ncbi:FkbM family methyltransferase [Emticicia sp. 17c]|uniref:FkbM family methyltransferase n=1 Tax=Emticicia sp. 17c TaxID=3127704 RepID=UPI00301DC6F6